MFLNIQKLLFIACFAGLEFSDAAVSVNIQNYDSLSNGVPVLNADGVTFASTATGCIAVGSLAAANTTFNFSGTSVSSIISAFKQFGANGEFRSDAPGLFSGTISTILPNNDTSFLDRYVYTLIGNGTTIANSTKLAVFFAGTGVTFPIVSGTGIGSTTTNITTTASTVVFGQLVTLGANQPVTSPTTSTYSKGVRLVPEPSAMLLGAISTLALLRRRRTT